MLSELQEVLLKYTLPEIIYISCIRLSRSDIQESVFVKASLGNFGNQ